MCVSGCVSVCVWVGVLHLVLLLLRSQCEIIISHHCKCPSQRNRTDGCRLHVQIIHQTRGFTWEEKRGKIWNMQTDEDISKDKREAGTVMECVSSALQITCYSSAYLMRWCPCHTSTCFRCLFSTAQSLTADLHKEPQQQQRRKRKTWKMNSRSPQPLTQLCAGHQHPGLHWSQYNGNLQDCWFMADVM